MSSPILGPRRAAMIVILAVLSVLLLPGALARANPTPTMLNLEAAADYSGAISISGSLVDDGGWGVPNAQLTASGGGRTLHHTVTNDDGTFAMQFSLPADMMGADQEVTISFAGDANHAPTSDARVFQFSQPVPQGATTLTLNLGAEGAYPGGLLPVSGSVALTSGEAVSGAVVSFTYEGTALPAATVLTGDDGSFSTFVEIPATAAEGSGQLVATFAGGGGLQGATVTAALTITNPASEPSPTPSEAAQPETAPASAAGSPTASPPPERGTAPVSAVPEPDNFPTMWFLAAAVIAVAAGGLTLLAVAARPRGRDMDDDAELIGLIGEAEPEAEAAAPQPLAEAAPAPPASSLDLGPGDQFQAPRSSGAASSQSWFRAEPREAARAQVEDWDDFSEVESTQVRRRAAGPRRGM
ncbi:MAG: hypothetical protein Q4D79_07220 [Propionibacteriaceae bacterium]|nr:hypothetical protein [Propionibacteriaceae bacterium]